MAESGKIGGELTFGKRKVMTINFEEMNAEGGGRILIWLGKKGRQGWIFPFAGGSLKHSGQDFRFRKGRLAVSESTGGNGSRGSQLGTGEMKGKRHFHVVICTIA